MLDNLTLAWHSAPTNPTSTIRKPTSSSAQLTAVRRTHRYPAAPGCPQPSVLPPSAPVLSRPVPRRPPGPQRPSTVGTFTCRPEGQAGNLRLPPWPRGSAGRRQRCEGSREHSGAEPGSPAFTGSPPRSGAERMPGAEPVPAPQNAGLAVRRCPRSAQGCRLRDGIQPGRGAGPARSCGVVPRKERCGPGRP